MSSHDSGCSNLSKEFSGFSSKRFHYVTQPQVVLERIDDKLLSHYCGGTKKSSDIKQVTHKKSLTKPVSKIPPNSISSARTNNLPEKRCIKLTNKSEDTLHIIDFRGNSSRQFIMSDAVASVKHNNETVIENQSVVESSKPTQKPFLKVQSKAEINNLENKKQSKKSVMLEEKREHPIGQGFAKPILILQKLENRFVGGKITENSQNTGREEPSHSNSMKKNMLVVQNKQVDMADSIRHFGNIKKGSSSKVHSTKNLENKQNRLSLSSTNSCTKKQKVIIEHVNKNVQSKQNNINSIKQILKYEKADTGIIQISKNVQNKHNQISPNAMKQSMIQVNKNLQDNNKNEEVSPKTMKQTVGSEKHGKKAGAEGHQYNEKRIPDMDHVASSMQNNMSIRKQMFPNSVPGTSGLKRKIPSEHDYHSTKLQKVCEISAADNADTSRVSGFINNTKDPPDQKTAKVTPMAKARKSITLPKPDTVKVNENSKLEWKSSRSRESLEAVTLLSQLVGKPIEADKMEVLLRREGGNRHIPITNSTTVSPPSKKSEGQGVSHISKLLANSVKPITSSLEAKIIRPSVELIPIPSTKMTTSVELIPIPSTTMTTSVTTATTSITTTAVVMNTIMTSPEVNCENSEILPPVSCNTTLSSASAVFYNKTPGSVNSSTITTQQENSVKVPCGSVTSRDSIIQHIMTDNSVNAVTANDTTKERSLPPQTRCDSPIPEEHSNPKTIYDVMREVSATYPAWNIHILEDTSSFCIAYIARNSHGVPTIAKCIELDEQFNAKVYIRQFHCQQFDGMYDNEESILGLLNTVDSLNPGSR